MKARCFIAFLLAPASVAIIIALTSATIHGSSVVLEKRRIQGAQVHLITADLNSPRIKVEIGLAANGIPHSESFSSMVRRHAPVAAVTGTYFDTRTLYPVGSIVIDGRAAYDNAIGTAVCFIKADGIECVSVAGPVRAAPGNYTVKFASTGAGERFNWAGVDTGFRTGPRLLDAGHYALNPRREGFKHPGLFGSHTRMALGVTAHNKLLLVSVSTPITFGKLAGIMKALGATDAVALDGGTSSAMYYRGQVIRAPGRALTNIVEVHEIHQPAQPVERLVHLPAPVKASPAGTAEEPALVRANLSRPMATPVSKPRMFEHVAATFEPPTLRIAKGRGAFIPIDRAKLARLKSSNHPEHFVDISANRKVMHHLVA